MRGLRQGTPRSSGALLVLAAGLLLTVAAVTEPRAPLPLPVSADAAAAGAPAFPAPTDTPPRLIVVLVLDLFREDFLTRHPNRLAPDGFRRLLRDGARFSSCAYPFAITETAPGHATIATGTTPDRHGIVSNWWYDRGLGRLVSASEDPEAPLVGTEENREGASPRRLVGNTFADELRLATGGRSRSFGVSLKTRSTVFSTGVAPTGAFWYDASSGRFVTSRYYAQALPGWAAAFNDARPADRYFGRHWSSEGRVLVRLGEAGARPDRPFYETLRSTPFIHDLLFEFTHTLVERERLGGGSATDFLFLGLSGFDYLVHDQGPYSEALGVMLQDADARLASFLRFLDARLGRGGYWLALTADHGVCPTIKESGERGLRPQEVEGEVVMDRIRRAIAKRSGGGPSIEARGLTTRIWLEVKDPARLERPVRDLARAAGEAALSIDGILGYIAEGSSNLDAATLEAFRLSTYPGRSPDLFLALRPFALVRASTPANHGMPWTYDSQVPLILFGPSFRPGTYHGRCSPADLAPTLAAVLGIPAPAMATGRVLGEALQGR